MNRRGGETSKLLSGSTPIEKPLKCNALCVKNFGDPPVPDAGTLLPLNMSFAEAFQRPFSGQLVNSSTAPPVRRDAYERTNQGKQASLQVHSQPNSQKPAPAPSFRVGSEKTSPTPEPPLGKEQLFPPLKSFPTAPLETSSSGSKQTPLPCCSQADAHRKVSATGIGRKIGGDHGISPTALSPGLTTPPAPHNHRLCATLCQTSVHTVHTRKRQDGGSSTHPKKSLSRSLF